MKMGVTFILLGLSAFLKLTSSAYVVSGRPPSFVTSPQTTYTSSASRLQLNCTVDGDPVPTVTWFRGEPLQPLTAFDGNVVNGSLIIPTVTDGRDSSTKGLPYQCVASNSFGTILSKPISVFTSYFGGFQGPPNITYYVKNTSGNARDEVALYCNISSATVPAPVIVWVDDRNMTVPNDGTNFIYLYNGVYLIIINIDPTTTALRTYRCRVTNAFSNMVLDSPTGYSFNLTTFASGTVFVYLPFWNVTAYDGDTNIPLYAVVATSGNTQLSFSISYPVVTLLTASGTTNPVQGTLNGPVRISDTGTMLRVTDGNSFTQFATLTVLQRQSPLNLTSSPSNSLYNFQGDSASFTCGYIAAPGVTLSWYKNGVQLTSSSSHVQISGSSLNISSLYLNDSGMYQCSVSNGNDSVWAQWAVGVRAPTLSYVSSSAVSPLVVFDGGNVTLTFQVQADPEPTSVQWYFNGSIIQTNSSSTLANNITGSTLYSISLLIDFVNNSTQGYYYASFSNRAGTQNTSSVFVTPPVAGKILSFNAVPACIALGSSIQLVCSVYGYPIPNVTFLGVTISGRFSQTGNTLFIVNLISTDSTKYTCRTPNGDQMDVQPPLCPILSAAGGGTVTVGSSVNIVCSSNNDLNGRNVTWYRSGTVVLTTTISQPNSLTTTLTLMNVQTSDSGLYSCSSMPGVSSNNVDLTVTAASESFPIGAIVGIAVGGSVALVLLILVVVIIIVCCVSRGKASYSTPVTMSSVIPDYGKGKGNVDVDSDEEDGGAPTAEAFNPQYESLPALRPSQPPSYKPTPSYMTDMPPSDDMDIIKVPPPDIDSTHLSDFGPGPYMPKDHDTSGSAVGDYRPRVEDFVSEDAQFV